MRLDSWKAALPLAIIAAAAPVGAQAQSESSGTSALSGWTFSASPYTYHFNRAEKENDFEPDDIKHSYVWLVGAEKRLSDRNFAGFVWFSNSFGQPTQYLYYGWRFEPISSLPKLFLKVSAGVIHGYKEPYHKKIPFNSKNGWGVTAIPAVGWQFSPEWSAQVDLLGTAAVMFQLNYTFK